jgi:hypothetical protein
VTGKSRAKAGGKKKQQQRKGKKKGSKSGGSAGGGGGGHGHHHFAPNEKTEAIKVACATEIGQSEQSRAEPYI